MCLLRAGQLRRAGDAAKSGQFIGQFSWVKRDPITVKGLNLFINGKYSAMFFVGLVHFYFQDVDQSPGIYD